MRIKINLSATIDVSEAERLRLKQMASGSPLSDADYADTEDFLRGSEDGVNLTVEDVGGGEVASAENTDPTVEPKTTNPVLPEPYSDPLPNQPGDQA